jgi:hypothetical protein
MSVGLGMLLALAFVVLGGLVMAGIVVLLRKRDSARSAKTETFAGKSEEPKQ